MAQSKKEDQLKKISPIKAIDKLMRNPLRMQILFYLLTFGELSLSDLTKMLGKTKSTINHHTLNLEDKRIRILLSREQLTKNYKEKFYRINPTILDFFESKEKIDYAIEKEKLDKKHLIFLFQSFTTFMYSIMQRFINYIKDHPNKLPPKAIRSSIRIHIIDYKQYKKKINEINEIFEDLPQESIYSPPSKNSYAIFTISLPYGEIFKSIIKNDKISPDC